MERLVRFGVLAVAALVPCLALVIFAGTDPGKATEPSRAAAPAPSRQPPTARPQPAGPRPAKAPAPAPVPSAAEFARSVLALANLHAQGEGERTRIARVRCVQGSPGHYLCSYSVTRPGADRECRLMEARWTPAAASTVTVVRSGRTGRCGSVREALASLPAG
jgi:hypothetical protein